MAADVVKVWDPVVRLFHWSLVVAFFVAYFTEPEDSGLAVHVWAGYFVCGLIVLRIVWGFAGSPTRASVISRSGHSMRCGTSWISLAESQGGISATVRPAPGWSDQDTTARWVVTGYGASREPYKPGSTA